jgi:cell wall-associated NlpC family hydrolase
MSWAAQYIGRPWVNRAFDCWAFFRLVQRAHFGVDLAAVDVDAMKLREVVRAFADSPERANWEEVAIPQDGDAVLMGRNRQPLHIGVWVDGGILHCARHSGVVFQSPVSARLCGWSRIGYWRRK